MISICLIVSGLFVKNSIKNQQAEKDERVLLTGSITQIINNGTNTMFYVDFIYNGEICKGQTIHYTNEVRKYSTGDAVRIKYDPTGKNVLLLVDDADLIPVSSSAAPSAGKFLLIIGIVFLILSLTKIIKSCI